jgi:multiple sugar transport system ATP-binding protein
MIRHRLKKSHKKTLGTRFAFIRLEISLHPFEENSSMTTVRFERVSKVFGDFVAVQDLSVQIDDGEFLVMVGPSGCGKTTTLRMLAGLETPSYGRIWIDDKDVTLMPPGQRGIAMVFQSYALYPHMTVYKNLAFGLEVRGESKKLRAQKVKKVAGLLGLDALLDRKPAALSGGQRQRIALGRAMIHEPKLFLLDEPLSNLDAALRSQMRFEISDLQKRLGVPTVYVTHDQVEAMTMGHRIAVFGRGRMVQIGTPEQLFKNPEDREVATFIGSPKMNIVRGEIEGGDSGASLRFLGETFTLTGAQSRDLSSLRGAKVEVGIRPQDIHWIQDAPSRCEQRANGIVEGVEPTGAETFVMANVGGELVNARFPSFAPVRIGASVQLAFDRDDLHIFDSATGRSLISKTIQARSRLTVVNPHSSAQA